MKITRMPVAFLAAALFAGGAVLCSPPPDFDDPAAVQRLVAELGDAKPEVRDRAQKDLDAVPFSNLEKLRSLAATTTGAEAKARLETRLNELDDIAALNPRLMTLQINDAGIPGVAAALSQATGARVSGNDLTATGVLKNTYSLDVRDAPFCDILAQLSAQHPLAFNVSSQGLELRPAGAAPALIASHGALLSLGAVGLPGLPAPAVAAAARGAGPAVRGGIVGNGNQLHVPLFLLVDPAAQLVAVRSAKVSLSDEGDHLAAIGSSDAMITALQTPLATGWSRNFSFRVNADLGNAVRIGGQLVLDVALETTSKQIDAAKHLNEAIPFGDDVVTLSRLAPSGVADAAGARALDVEIQVAAQKGALTAPPVPGGSAGGMSISSIGVPDGKPLPPPLTLSILDAKGRQLAAFSVPGNSAMSVRRLIRTVYEDPLKLVLTSPTKTREVTLPFDFRNVPVSR